MFALNIQSQQEIPDEKLVSYSAESKSLRDILVGLTKKTKINIAFQDHIIPSDSLITMRVSQKPLGYVIDELIKGTGTKYKIVGNQIVIIKDPFYESKDEITISGYIRDVESKESLISANIYTFDKVSGTVSNEYGFFSLSIPKGVQRVYISYLGYKLQVIEVPLTKDTTINVSLDPSIILNEVVIQESKLIEPESSVASVTHLPLDKIESIMSLGGEPDVIRLTHQLSGVSTGADGFGGMSIRGGSVDQNLILLDGVPIYNPFHALGVVSVFNSKVINSATLYKSGFPARYGSRLASVLDIRTREGNKERIGGDFSLGLIAAKATLEGPIVKGKSSFLVSARRTILDPWINLASGNLFDEDINYSFYDINLKTNFKVGKKTRLYLSYYNGKDNFKTELIEETKTDDTTLNAADQLFWNWGNTMGVVRLSHQLSNKAFLKSSAYYTRYKFNSFELDRFQEVVADTTTNFFYNSGIYNSSIRDLGFTTEVDFIPNPRNLIKAGVNIIYHTFTPGILFADQVDQLVPDSVFITSEVLNEALDEPNINGVEFQLYIEDEFRFNEHNRLNVGIHQSIIINRGKTFFNPQPRLAYLYQKDAFSWKASVSFVSQYLHLIANSGIGLPTDVWLPSTDILKPQTGWVASIGSSINNDKGYEYGSEIYYKQMRNAITFTEGAPILINNTDDWEEVIPVGKGSAYGIEFFFNKSIGKVNWIANYTLAYSNRQFDEINNGEPFRYRYDRRHSVKFSLLYKINYNAEFTLSWNYASGNPVTFPEDSRIFIDDEGNSRILLIYPERNNYQLDPFHRLDLGFNFYNKTKLGRHKFHFGLFNAYSRIRNYLFIDLDLVDTDPVKFDTKGFSILPILPNFSWSITF